MSNLPFFIDLHCHPQFKPYGWAHNKSGYASQSKTLTKSSLWFKDNVSDFKSSINIFGNLTLFSQANLQAAYNGNVQVMSVSVGSVEKGFVARGEIKKLLTQLVTGFGKYRVDAIKNMKDYWADLQTELRFFEECENVPIKIEKRWLCYKWVKDFKELKKVIENNQKVPVKNTQDNPFTIAMIPSIEGLHILNCGLDRSTNADEVIANAHKLKKMKNAPWFTAMCHHFNNDLCGHARSLKGALINMLDQSKNLNTGFSELGKKVMEIMLDDTIGRPIYIDIKHMSVESRKYYFALIKKDKYKGKVPVIISHGVCNGIPDYDSKHPTFKKPGNDFFVAPYKSDKNNVWITANEINFYDNEIIELVRTNGIMGLQLDERRIVNQLVLDKLPKERKNSKAMKMQRSKLVWNQIQYIAELLDKRGLNAWHNVAIGSDYDGIVDPINSFWTMEDFVSLKDCLLEHATAYIGKGKHPLRWENNHLSAEEIIANVFHNNAWNFFEKWY